MRGIESKHFREKAPGMEERRFVLGLESTGLLGGAAIAELVRGGAPRLRAEHLAGVEATHSERLMPAVHAAMRAAGIGSEQIAAVAVSVGPGSYTGIRIGVMTAKALAFGWGLPVVAVPTLEALTWQAPPAAAWVIPALPARRGAVFGALYRMGQGDPLGWERPVPPGRWTPLELLAPLAADEAGGTFCVVGEGAGVVHRWLETQAGKPFRGRAVAEHWSMGHLRPSSIALLGATRFGSGQGQEPLAVEPIYLRETEAERRAAVPGGAGEGKNGDIGLPQG